MVVEGNDRQTLHDLMTMSHTSCGDEYTVLGCSEKLRKDEACKGLKVQIISSDQDRIAGTSNVLDLHNALGDISTYDCLEGGHLVPFENPSVWRRKLLQFLDE